VLGDVVHGVGVDGARWRLCGVRGSMTSRPLGDASVPRFKEVTVEARRRHVLLAVDEDGIHEGFLVFFLFVLDLSVRIMG
jgi:hypothetical protein